MKNNGVGKNEALTSRWQQFLFPISRTSQLQTAFISMILVLVGSWLGGVSKVWNLNLLAPIIVGYVFGSKMHPRVWVGPLAVTFSIMGLSWIVCLVVGIANDMDTTMLITQYGLYVFLAMTASSGVRKMVQRYRHSS